MTVNVKKLAVHATYSVAKIVDVLLLAFYIIILYRLGNSISGIGNQSKLRMGLA